MSTVLKGSISPYMWPESLWPLSIFWKGGIEKAKRGNPAARDKVVPECLYSIQKPHNEDVVWINWFACLLINTRVCPSHVCDLIGLCNVHPSCACTSQQDNQGSSDQSAGHSLKINLNWVIRFPTWSGGVLYHLEGDYFVTVTS